MDPEKCVYCTLCAKKCPQGAIEVDRKEKTWKLDSEKCVEFNIVPFEAVEIPKFRFSIKNIKNDYPYITAEQTTFN